MVLLLRVAGGGWWALRSKYHGVDLAWTAECVCAKKQKCDHETSSYLKIFQPKLFGNVRTLIFHFNHVAMNILLDFWGP